MVYRLYLSYNGEVLKNKLFLRITLNSALGLLFVFIWSRFVDLEELWGNLQKADFKIVVPLFLAFFVLSSSLRAFRLKVLLSQKGLPFKDILMLNWLSQFLSFSIPIRAGEVAKSAYLTAQFNIPLGKALILVFLDRFLDFWAVLLLVSVLLTVTPTALPESLAKTLLLLFAVFTLAFILILKSHNLFKKLIVFLSNFLVVSKLKSGFVSFTHSIVDGFEVFRSQPVLLGKLLVITFAAFVSDGMLWAVVFSSIGVNLPMVRAILGNALSALTFLIPAAPGYVGSAEVSALAVFSGVLGIESNIASTAAVLTHILTLVVLLGVGLIAIYFLKFDLGIVWKKIRGG